MDSRAGGSFTYTAEPHSAPRRLYSQTEPEMRVPLPLLSDPRVIRGNTYSLARKVANARVAANNAPGKSSSGGLPHSAGYSHRKEAMLSSSLQQERSGQPFYTFTSKPFATANMDLSVFLVDERDSAVVPTSQQETQADSLIPLPPRQPYIPRKTGVDNETQITADDTAELFDFDQESAPLVAVIVHKTLEQALTEVNAETELAAILAGIDDCEKQRASEVKWIQEQEEMMLLAQKKVLAGVEDVRHRLSLQRSTKRSIAGLQMARQILPNSINSVVEQQWQSADHIAMAQDTIPEILQQAVAQVEAFRSSAIIMEELALAAGAAIEQSDATPPIFHFPLNKLTVRFVREYQPPAIVPPPREPAVATETVEPGAEGAETEEGADSSVANERAPVPELEAEEPAEPILPPVEIQVVTQLSIPIAVHDSALTLERKVTALLRQLLLSQQQQAEQQAEAVANGLVAPDTTSAPSTPVLPLAVDIYGPITALVTDLYDRQGLLMVPMARDAQLSFYPLDIETLTVDVMLQPAE